jgi:hypothetical protein
MNLDSINRLRHAKNIDAIKTFSRYRGLVRSTALLLSLALTSASLPAHSEPKYSGDLQTLTISIVRIQLSGKLISIGLDPTGSLSPPKDPDVAGWYDGGPLPSDVGNTVIVGSLDSRGKTGVFWELRQAVVGDQVVIRSKSESMHVISSFLVTEVTLFRKADFPTDRLYANLSHRGVALVTDGGPDSDNTEYLGNLVVFARLHSKTLMY